MTRSTTAATIHPKDQQEFLKEEQPLATVTSLHPDAIKTNRRGRRSLMRSEAGLATAEYAIATLAAVGFAALLVAVLSSGEIRGLLMSLITNALSFG